MAKNKFIIWFKDLSLKDVPKVGGKNAALGEMYSRLARLGIKVPNGFAVTSRAYWHFLKKSRLKKKISQILQGLNTRNIKDLQKRGRKIRQLILKAPLPPDLEKEIITAYRKLGKIYFENPDVAVRSSATAEDLPSIGEDEFVLAKVDEKIIFRPVKEIYCMVSKNKKKIEVLGLDKDHKVRWQEVAELYRHPVFNKKLIKVTTKSGRSITITPDHSLLTLEPNNFRLKTLPATQIKRGTIIPTVFRISNYFYRPTPQSSYLDVRDILKRYPIVEEGDRLRIKHSSNCKIQNSFPSRLEINKELAYFLGLYAAKGSVYKNKRNHAYTIDISCQSSTLSSKIKPYLERLALKPKVTENVRIHNKVLGALLEELVGKPLENTKGKGRSAAIKGVPEFIFSQPPEVISSFIRGCFDGDGYIAGEEIEYVSVSEKLINGLAVLFGILNIKVYIRRGKYLSLCIPIDQFSSFKERVNFSERRKVEKLEKLIKKFDGQTKYQDFTDVFPKSRFINEQLERSLKNKFLSFTKKAITSCPYCNGPSIKNGHYYKSLGEAEQRFYCRKCDRAFSQAGLGENELQTTTITGISSERDEYGRFFLGFTPWNKDNRKQLKVLGRKYLQRLIYELGEVGEKLKNIANSDVIWDKIVKIEKLKYKGYVYDFVVPDIQNFSAGFGGVITHNTASFAGQQETYLNVRGEKELLRAVKKCVASLFTDRAISYRVDQGFEHGKIALSVGVQKMARSDLASSGVAFTLDTETGFDKVVVIEGSWGLGEMVVKGQVVPDEFIVFKPTLKQGFKAIISKELGQKALKLIYVKSGTKKVKVPQKKRQKLCLQDREVLELAKMCLKIEEHFSKKHQRCQPMDIEWAKDGRTGKIFIVQARPETVHSAKEKRIFKEYVLEGKGKILVRGIAVGTKIASGRVRVIKNAKNIGQFKKGEILVTELTDPDWEPVMKMASAIVTDKGGRTAHAAIVSRELGIPCIVGAQNATKVLKNGQLITVDCSSGESGKVYQGKIPYEVVEHKLDKIPVTRTKVMVNIGSPDEALKNHWLPARGVGLAREEFIIASQIKIHPQALIDYRTLKSETLTPKPQTNTKFKIPNSKLKKILNHIDKLTVGYKDKTDFYIDKLAEGIAKIAAAFWPYQVLVRFSDFKTNEYKNLIGGELYEPKEENPMLGWRGASRYYHPLFKKAFLLECKAIKKVRDEMGLKNVVPMIPFCRTPEEGEKVVKIMAEQGLDRSKDPTLKIYVMAEIPSNAILAQEFLEIFDGMSVGSNDLTQLTLGLDRDSSTLSPVGDERNKAVKELIKTIIKKCRQKKKYIGICGQAPSDYPEFAQFLVKEKIDSISLNPDSVIKTILAIKKAEKSRGEARLREEHFAAKQIF